MDKLIITVALTGNVPTREMNANLPLTADQMAADAKRCYEAGAAVFHVHARDALGKPTLDIAVYRENVRRIKALVPVAVLQLSTGARAGKDWEERVNPGAARAKGRAVPAGAEGPTGQSSCNSAMPA